MIDYIISMGLGNGKLKKIVGGHLVNKIIWWEHLYQAMNITNSSQHNFRIFRDIFVFLAILKPRAIGHFTSYGFDKDSIIFEDPSIHSGNIQTAGRGTRQKEISSERKKLPAKGPREGPVEWY